jgi:hypothetical protein
MKLATIQKLGGFALIAGAILFATYSVLFLSLFPADEIHRDFSRIVLSPPWIGVAAIAFAGVVLMVFGFAAVYSRLHQGAGVLGLVGFAFIEVAYLLQACKVTWEIFLYPIIAGNRSSTMLLRDGILRDHPLVHAFKAGASATIFLGILLFCFALVRSKEFPKAAGILIFVGALVYALGPVLSMMVAIGGIMLLSLGCLLLGLELIHDRRGRGVATSGQGL